jgi:galactokinase/mevalonate kinase-like predicted kinase
MDVQSKADLPWGIGLGSSGAYHSALISVLAKFKKQRLSKLSIAKLAYDLETGIEKDATGKQDSLACLFKGFSNITYYCDDSVTVDQIPIPTEWQKKLTNRLLLFDTGERRRSRDSIKDILSRKNDSLLNEIAKLPDMLARAWRALDIDFLASALDLQEEYRSQLTPSCKSQRTDRFLGIARRCGAGARLTGAGLGCLLCYCHEERQQQLREKLCLPEIRFSILWRGR